MGYHPNIRNIGNILPILTLFIFCFSSKVVFSEQIENKPQCNDIAQLKNAAKGLYDSKKNTPNWHEIDATDLVMKYIRTGCDIPHVFSSLINYGYELFGNGVSYQKDIKTSESDKKIILDGTSFIASTWLKPTGVFWWFNACSSTLILEINHEYNQVKNVKATINTICL